jgi:hypothetical protein
MKPVLLLLALVPVSSGASPPPESAHAAAGKAPIGRIFFSPSQRRHRDEDKNPAPEASNSAAAPESTRLVVNGAVSSSEQGRAVWVNGAPIENSAKRSSAWTDRSGTVWLRDEQHVTRRVQPGQTVDVFSGTVQDLLPSGSVRAGAAAKPR